MCIPNSRRGSTPVVPTILVGFVLAGLGGPAHLAAVQDVLPPAEAEASRGFTRIASVRELPDGRLLLVDQGENRLRVLDRSLDSVEELGREGEGPGEYLGVGWLYGLNGSTTILTDRLRRNWHLLDGAEFERTMAPTNPVILQAGGPTFFGVMDGGKFLASRGSIWDPTVRVQSHSNADSLVAILVHGDAEFERVVSEDTVAVLEGQGLEGDCATRLGTVGSDNPGGGNARRTCSPLMSADVPLLFADGWLAVARVHPYRVDWRTPEGEWIEGPLLDTEASPAVDDRHRCWATQGWPVGGPTDCDDSRANRSSWPDQVPAFLPRVPGSLPGLGVPVVLAAPGGDLLIRRAPLLSQPGARYDLVDRTGARKARLELPARHAIVGFGADVVYTVAMDEFDLQWLRRHPWPFD